MPLNNEKVVLSYYLPGFGHVGGTLHKESASLYHAFEKSKELERIKKVPQLGIVAEALPGSRHTRWEYLHLLVHLIKHCTTDRRMHLNSEVKLEAKVSVSSTLELLNSWAILLQIGHLFWTFASEKLLLDEIFRNNTSKEALLAEIDFSARDWAQEIIDNLDYYRFHLVLGQYRVQRLLKDEELKKNAIQILNAYAAPKSATVENLRSLYMQIRRIAYLALDAEYSPSLLGLRLNAILSTKDALTMLVDPRMSRHDVEIELDTIEGHLLRNTYLGRETLLVAATSESYLRSKIQTALSTNVQSAVGILLNDQSLARSKRDMKLVDIVRFDFNVTLLRVFDIKLGESANQKIRALTWAKDNALAFHLAFEIDAQKKVAVFQVHSDPGDRRSVFGGLAYSFEFLNDITAKLVSPGKHYFAIIEQSYEELIFRALNFLSSTGIQWEWKQSAGKPPVLWVSPFDNEDTLEDAIKPLAKTAARKHEIMATFYASKGMQHRPIIMTTGNLLAYSQLDKTTLLELDGLAITLDKSRHDFVVTLVEAKAQQKSAENDAKEALKQKLARLSPSPEVRVGKVHSKKVRGKGYAWVNVRLRYKPITPTPPAR
jgi:hypothetical protein